MNEAMGRDVAMCCSTEDGHAMGMCCCRDLTALRATIQQQAERIERLTAERDAAYIRERAKYEATMVALQRQLAEREATIAELTEQRDGFYSPTVRYEVDDPCRKCGGSGKYTYGSTATWRGGIGGQAMTVSVCDSCWGSGDEHRPWPSWKQAEQREQRVRKAVERISKDTVLTRQSADYYKRIIGVWVNWIEEELRDTTRQFPSPHGEGAPNRER